MWNGMIALDHTSKGMDGEGLVGLNNVHLELKVNRAAASQGNSTSNTREKWKKQRQMWVFVWGGTPTGEWEHARLRGRMQSDSRALWQMGGQNPNTHCTHTHTHTYPHTFVQVVRPIGQYEQGHAGHRWQGKRELESAGSLPPCKECGWVVRTREEREMRRIRDISK